MKKKLLSFLLAAVLAIPVLTPTASALPASQYTYRLRITTRDESNAGTNASIYGGVKTYNDGVRRVLLDNDGVDDFERGETNNFYIGLYNYPWMIEKIHVHQGDNKGTASDWKPGTVELWVPKMNDISNPTIKIGGTYTLGGTWDKDTTKECDVSSYTKRSFTSIGSYDNWGQTIYLDKDSSGTLSLSWNGKVTDQYGTYNIYGCDDAGSFSFSNSFNASTTTLFSNNFTKPSSTENASLNLAYSTIYNEMVNKGIGKATLKFTMSVPARSSNAGSLFSTSGDNIVHTETVTIYRKCFDIGNVSYSETPVFTARSDNDFLNREKKNVTITVSPTSLHAVSSISNSDIQTIVKNFTCTAALYSGNGTSVKLTDLTYAPSADNTKIVFKGTVPSDFTSNGAGVNLYLTNVSTKYGGQTYYLNSGSTTWNSYISTLKVDTVSPTVSITDKDGAALDISNTLAASHTFYLSGSETLYKSNTAPHPENDEAYIDYSLLSDGAKVNITNYNGGTGTYLNVTVPISTAVMPDLPITLRTPSASEGVYTLAFTGYDDAGNAVSNSTVENVILDSAPPRYALAENTTYQDAQLVKHTEYNFTLNDICNTYRDTLASWARLYYVFVPAGETLPELDMSSVTGEIETTVGRWNFVEADSNGELPTILISLALKESFLGDLYIKTKDSVGNETDIIKFASDLKIYNYETTDTIVTSSNLTPKKSFDITFSEAVSGIDGIYTTEYHWVPVSHDATPLTQSYIKYEGQNVGAGTQLGDDGEPVVMNGTYKLEYKVTETRSKNTAIYSKNYIFDNLPPVIDVAWFTENERPLQIQQANIVITDVSGVDKASYSVYTADGSLVSEGTLTPTVGGDGKTGVRESIKLQPTKNGVYRLTVYSVDVNGDEFLHDTSAAFAVRSEKPTVASAGDDISVKIDGISVTNSEDYTVYLQVMDNLLCADDLYQDQFVKYSVSTDGISFGPWITLDEPMDTHRRYIEQNAVIVNPVPLTEGMNTLYFKVACAEEGNTADPAITLISDVYTYSIIYDTTAPSYSIEYSTSDPTTEDVTVTLTVFDANGVTGLSESDKYLEITEESSTRYTLTVMRNIDTTVTLYDAVGNETEVPITVTCIDKDAPKITAESVTFTSGERTDATVVVTVNDYNPTTTRFALIADPSADSEPDDESFALFDEYLSRFSVEKTENGRVTEYSITLRGLDGSYAIAAESVDMLGNTAILTPGKNIFTLIDAVPEITGNESTPEITKSTAQVTLTFNVPLAVLNPLLATGETDEENEAIAANMAERVYSDTYVRSVSDPEEKKLYAVDEAGRTCTLTFASGSTFIEGFKLTYQLFKNGDEIENGAFTAFDERDDITLVIESNPAYELQTFDISEAVLTGFEFDEDASVVYKKDAPAAPETPAPSSEGGEKPAEEKTVYTKLVFNALRDGTSEKSVSFVSYTAEGLEADRYQNETVNVSLFDETVPQAVFTPSAANGMPTNKNVTVEAVFGDTESGIKSVVRILDGVETELSSKTRDSVEFSENGSVSYEITNNADMTATVTYEVENIDKTPIEEGKHYTVKYYYENYRGKWKAVEDGNYYRAVKAVIEFEDCDKELSVVNNGTLCETLLTSERTSFTFSIKDSAGNTTEQPVSYEYYDNDGGTIKWSLSNYNKTNKPVTAFVTITDKDNVNEIVHSEVRDSSNELYEWNGEVLGNEYSVTLPLSGNYIVTAYDAAGNAFTEQITVSNIDTVKPTITKLSYSTPPNTVTTRSVLVKIEEFSKSNVTVTGIERSDNLGEYDIVYTPGATEIRFKKSGYISVFFIDDYGNENASVISVNNICSDPPALEAVAKLAEDELSVEISFRKQLDADGIPVDRYRELKDLCVVYDGVTYTTDKTFTIRQNGDYTFTIFDESGTAQTIRLSVTDIDDRAPVIKTVSWSYEYLEENGGVWEKKYFEKTLEIGKDTSGTEAGYTVGPDIHKTTNSDVTVTLSTDKDTSILGSNDIKSRYNSLIYAENGLFTFNLAAINGTVSSYGVEVAIIDKTAPTLTFEGADELIFIEGMTDGRDPDFAYSKSKFYDFVAYDVFDGVRTDLTDKVQIDFGDFNPDDISANVFDRTKPYTVTYTVYDEAGNKTQLRRTVRLVGFYDTIALIGGKMPNSANSIAVNSSDIVISLKNFAGTYYARYAKGIYTMGQMKTLGTPITAYNGELAVRGLEDGWYTVYIQTDKRDYFTITVYVNTAD